MQFFRVLDREHVPLTGDMKAVMAKRYCDKLDTDEDLNYTAFIGDIED
jgi:hypothetical protein